MREQENECGTQYRTSVTLGYQVGGNGNHAFGLHARSIEAATMYPANDGPPIHLQLLAITQYHED